MDEVQKFLYELCKSHLDDIHFINDDGSADADKWDLYMYVKDVVNDMEKQIKASKQ